MPHHKTPLLCFDIYLCFIRYLSRSILDDVRWLLREPSASPSTSEAKDPWFGPVRHASDYFPTICEAAIYLIKNGLAYVDDLTPG